MITGSARGLPLLAPRGERPTMDRVRGAVFSMLGEAVPGARVLDLFAGAGAYGIEALSRGAAEAVFVDSSPTSMDCVRKNLARARLVGSLQTMDAFRFLELYAPGRPFDILFADPPYSGPGGDEAARLLASGLLEAALEPGGLAVVERRTSAAASESPGLDLLRQRAYGGTEILILRKP
ncbi:MAG: 16S rRNA (guanine(966)-N(2))-methyltransferase RsmD [Terrimicrobiaceae bacterium]|nr:16S rRNA (guanine(966)-N(2))-methyltransferase RsmD [Terrimicrobiaceae bacterium]